MAELISAEILSLALAVLAFLFGVRRGEKHALKEDTKERTNLADRVTQSEKDIRVAVDRINQHDLVFVTISSCETLRSSLRGDVNRDWMESYCTLGERLAAMESTLKMVANNQMEVFRAQTTLADTQRATSAVLAELSDNLHRRATDRKEGLNREE